MSSNKRLGMVAAVAVAIAATMAGVSGGEPVSPNGAAKVNSLFRIPLSLGLFAPVTAAQLSQTGLERYYNSFTPELYASTMQTTLSAQRAFRNAIPSVANYSQTAHMQNALNTVGGDSSQALAMAPVCTDGPRSRWVMWDTPFYVKETQDRKDGYLGYDMYSSGFATGLGRLIGDSSMIGLAVGYDGRKQHAQDGYRMDDKADAFHAALYGGTAIGCFFLDGYAGYSRTWHRTERVVEFGGSAIGGVFASNGYTGNYNDTVLSAGLKASYVWILPSDFRITPAIGLDYGRVSLDGFQEKVAYTGTPFFPTARGYYQVDDATYNSFQMPITVSVNRTFRSGFLAFGGACSLWTPELRAGWVPHFGAKQSTVSASHPAFIGVSPAITPFVSADSAPVGNSHGTVGAGLKIQIREKYIFAVDYDYRFTKNWDQHYITATYGVCF